MSVGSQILKSLTSLAVIASLALAARAQEKKPEGAAAVRQSADAAFQAQNWGEAAELYAKVVASTPEDPIAWQHLGYALHSMGKIDEALKAHLKAAGFPQTAGIGAYNVACVYSLKNEPDKAFEWLEKSIAAGFAAANYLDTDTDMTNIKSDPRFAKLRKEAASNDRQQGFVATTPRASTRLAFFGQNTSAGQIAIDYGQPTWRDDFGTAVESKRFAGQRWRLGQDFWTTWDASCDVTLGGTAVKAGQYFLVLKQSADGALAIEFLDADAVRAAKIDSSAAGRYTGPVAATIALKAEKGDAIAKQLQFQIAHEGEGKGSLSVSFGPYKATVPMQVDMPKTNNA